MAVRKSQRRGKPCLVIDIRYTSKDGKQLRLRKDAQVQTMAAAKAEVYPLRGIETKFQRLLCLLG